MASKKIRLDDNRSVRKEVKQKTRRHEIVKTIERVCSKLFKL